MAVALHAFLLQLLLFFFASVAEANNPRKVYLVQMKVGGHRYGSSSGHQELLGEVLDDDSTVANALIYSYMESFTGFSASLTQNERQKLKRRREVLEVSRSRNLKLHTTRSWDFMNLTLAANRNPEKESDLVVAVLDTGIWPYSDLFGGDSSPPESWLNKCEDITCNNKIVGARSYYPEKANLNLIEKKSVIDVDGHGTHIASIVAGREIEKASYFGLSKGTMRGGVPNAKIAVYKTCWKTKNEKGEEEMTCPEDAVLAAIEDAIKDEVDMISYSQGLPYPHPLQEDKIAWAFLRALGKGILTSTSAGNLGLRKYYSVTNSAPWVMTVAASSKDRFFNTKLELKGENKPITVYDTINPFKTQDSFYPLLYETASTESTRKRDLVSESNDDTISSNHDEDEKGKDVFFEYSQTKILEKAVKKAEGVIAMANFNFYNESKKLQFPTASIFLDNKKGKILKEYYNKDNSEKSAKIHKTVEIPREEGWIPTVANLSSRGPNCDNLLANILKPDIAAPGLDILAGWPENVKLLPEFSANDYRNLRYNILSGTSMACPHATGLALYLKSFNQLLSPSGIKSALMTTATEMNDERKEFAHGSGLLSATKVLEPGLIYETKQQDYIDFMCKQGYNTEKLRSDVGNHMVDCSSIKIDHNADLNYPTMTARVDLNTEFTKVFYRTVTNVDDKESTYLGKIKHRGDKSFDTITVEPEKLHFKKLGETKSFTVTVTGKSEPDKKETFMIGNTWLTWTELDGSRQVRSPIVIYSIPKRSSCSNFPED